MWIGKHDDSQSIEPRLLLEIPEYGFGEVQTGTMPNGKPWPGNLKIRGIMNTRRIYPESAMKTWRPSKQFSLMIAGLPKT